MYIDALHQYVLLDLFYLQESSDIHTKDSQTVETYMSTTETKKEMDNILRKVQSMDCVNPSSMRITTRWEKNTHPSSKMKSSKFQLKASKFSQRARFHAKDIDHHSKAELSSTPRFEYKYKTFDKDATLTALSEINLSRPTSVLSLSGLVGESANDYNMYSHHPSTDDIYSQNTFNPVQDLGTLVEVLTGRRSGVVRIGQLIRWAIFLILFTGTISDGANRIHHYLHGDVPNKVGKGQLGSAMISSITGMLSPVLPFAGGMDLRRDDNWKSYSNWKWIFGKSSLGYRTRNQDGLTSDPIVRVPRGGAQRRHIQHDGSMVLSASDPFFPLDEIGQMTLREVAYMFRYMVESGKKHFDLNHFIQKDFENEPVNKRMVNAVKAMQKAVEASRGKNISSMVSNIDYYDDSDRDDAPLRSRYGDIDALHFCGAMRVLAEWRVLRQVPPGYKGYKVGMDLGHKDVVQNLAKIESAVHDWISQKSYEVAEREAHLKMHQNCKEAATNAPPECFTLSAPNDEDIKPRSPSLRELLQFEIETDHHPNHKLPRLKEKSAAMGLLWVRRQLHYQTAVFNNVVSVPKIFPNAIAAVASAYSDVYGEIHGWTVQKIFNYSFKSAPHVEEIFCHMNPTRHAEVKMAALNNMSQNDVMDQMDPVTTTILVENSDNSNDNPFFRFFSDVHRHVENELEKFGDHIGGEWDKVVCNVSNIIQHDKHDCFSTEKGALSTRGGSGSDKVSSGRGFNDDELDRFVKSEMAKDASNHIVSFLKIVKPVLSDLEGLFEEMNMNDPTKV